MTLFLKKRYYKAPRSNNDLVVFPAFFFTKNFDLFLIVELSKIRLTSTKATTRHPYTRGSLYRDDLSSLGKHKRTLFFDYATQQP